MQVKLRKENVSTFFSPDQSRSERSQRPEKPLHLQGHYFYLYLVQLQSHISVKGQLDRDF